MADKITTGPLKVFVWTTPRSLSNAFLKCMSNVPNTVAWHEPYSQVGKHSHLALGDPMLSTAYRELVEKHGGASEIAKIKGGYDASDKHFDWVKEQLESDVPGKNLIIVKAFAESIVSMSLHDKIPKGFRHTFLIRDPHKSLMSLLKNWVKLQAKSIVPPNLPFDKALGLVLIQGLNELWKYIKAEGLESRPVIIDADDLLENPTEMIEAYCKEVGIPFTEDLLTWPAGDDVMTNVWMTPKQNILTFRTLGFSDVVHKSTGFQKPSTSTGDSNNKCKDELLKKIPPTALAKVKEIADREMPYYDELYAERLTVNKQENR